MTPAELRAAIAAGYCPHCGRGDCAPTADDYEQARRNAVRIQTLLDETRDRIRNAAAAIRAGAPWAANADGIADHILAALKPTA